MKRSVDYTIETNRKIAKNTFELVLCGDTSDFTAPGQFCNIALEGRYLRRPISVCDVTGDKLVLIYKTVGDGTKQLSEMQKGERLNVLTGLGNGYDLARCGERTVVVGGGAGVPPMFGLAKALKAQGREVTAVLGFNSADEIFYVDEFGKLGVKTVVCTADGSVGVKGFVTDALKTLAFDHVCCCGPLPMLRAVYDATQCGGQYSFEERMACGFGACMGCTCKTKYGAKRICKDGPVLEREEIIWE